MPRRLPLGGLMVCLLAAFLLTGWQGGDRGQSATHVASVRKQGRAMSVPALRPPTGGNLSDSARPLSHAKPLLMSAGGDFSQGEPSGTQVAEVWNESSATETAEAESADAATATAGADVKQSPDPSAAHEKLALRMHAIMDEPAYHTAHWGVLVVEQESNEVLFAHQPDRLFAPASTTKLFSTAAALVTLGADYQFHTPVYLTTALDQEGNLPGDLILVASGDLTMGGRTLPDGKIDFRDFDHTYATGSGDHALTDPNPLAGIMELAQQVHQSGVRRVQGNVIVDARLFEPAESTGSGPVAVSPICINDNIIDVLATPAAAGSPAQITWRPQTALVSVDSQVMTAPEGQHTQVDIREVEPFKYVVRGQIAAGHAPVLATAEVQDPARFARSLFVEALAAAGVRVDASALGGNPSELLPPVNDYAQMTKAAELISPPFKESVKLILKVSHNLHASTLPLLVAAQHGERTEQAGLRRQAAVLRELGVDVNKISFGGGAGGSRADSVTPQAAVQLLQAMRSRPEFAVYYAGLPILGQDGTLLKHSSPENPAYGHVHAKTGTFYWVNGLNGQFLMHSKALAGYMEARSGKKLVLAMFLNDVLIESMEDTTTAGKTLGRLCDVLYEEL